MSEGLFPAVDLAGDHRRVGWRLARLEVLNWGTFHGQPHVLVLDGDTTLLTGDIGSGKSTLVDAITTLLLPANRISYNKAAGSEAKERTLRSYVLGHYKSERVESTGTSRHVGLRDGGGTYSVVLGVFANEGHHETASIAQVFQQRDRTGQPDRFFVTAAQDLSISGDFAGFGSDLNVLRRRLRSAGAAVDKDFPAYGRSVRRMLGIRSGQALELFHQTVSMKSVGNLTEFVRSHMLEPADPSAHLASILSHFDDLTRAHAAVKRAQDQLAALDPLIVNCDKHDALDQRRAATRRQRDAVGLYFTEQELVLRARDRTEREARVALLDNELAEVRGTITGLRSREAGLISDRASAGGDRITELERVVKHHEETAAAARQRRQRYTGLLGEAGLSEVRDRAEFVRQREEVLAARTSAGPDQRRLDHELADALNRRGAVRTEAAEVQAELESLSARRSNLPRESLELRDRLCAALDLPVTDLPFAGELIEVAEEHAAWRGAAERVLRGLGLSLLVPHRHYPAVAAWVDDHHLGARLVYHRVPERQVRVQADAGDGLLRLRDVLVVEDGPFAGHLASTLAGRADHVCVDHGRDLRDHQRAVTRHGQVRSGERHEKDDRRRVDDPRRWVLGRSNLRKVEALERTLADLRRSEADAESVAADVQQRRDRVRARADVLSALATFEVWADLDADAPQGQADEAAAERDRLLQGSTRLAELDRALATARRRIEEAESERSRVEASITRESAELDRGRRAAERARSLLDQTPPDLLAEARAEYPTLERALRSPVDDPDSCARLAAETATTLSAAIERLQQQMNGVATTAQQQMAAVKAGWPAVTTEMDASIEAAEEYRRFRDRVRRDDLPRFEAEFKHQLTTNTIRELAGFASWLRRQADEIRVRVDLINESLGAIDYSPGRFIALTLDGTVNQDVRDFREQLRAVTSGALGGDGDERYSEQRFLEVKQVIDRFRGREGHAEADRTWTRRVTDVRNWHVFSAAEVDRETGEEWEHYRDSDGKSGGQKEKLAYTILAASLAYQFGLEWGTTTSRDFRFAVIDEAFGRGSDASTRYALSLFARLGLQLLVVTPLQKVHVIEPHVRAIGFVDNRGGVDSRVRTLTIEEYREMRRDHG